MAALEIGNAVRSQRAELKRQVFAGKLSLPGVIDPQVSTEWDEIGEGMRIRELLRAMRGYSHTRVRKLLTHFGGYGYTGDLKLEELGDMRRAKLATLLRERGIK